MPGWSWLIIPDVLRRACLLREPEHSTHCAVVSERRVISAGKTRRKKKRKKKQTELASDHKFYFLFSAALVAMKLHRELHAWYLFTWDWLICSNKKKNSLDLFPQCFCVERGHFNTVLFFHIIQALFNLKNRISKSIPAQKLTYKLNPVNPLLWKKDRLKYELKNIKYNYWFFDLSWTIDLMSPDNILTLLCL